jgi:uncharacterized RDD family membrane protein YckC
VSTNSSPLNPEATWKQEVNLRLAAHKSRRAGGVAAEEATAAPKGDAGRATSRASAAAARVAARYAQAPSYSQMQAEEARTAVRAAEIATEVALQAQAQAEAKLANLQAATMPQRDVATGVYPFRERFVERDWITPPASPVAIDPTLAVRTPAAAVVREEFVATVECEPLVQPAPQTRVEDDTASRQSFGLRWEPDLPARGQNEGTAVSSHLGERCHDGIEITAKDWWEAEPAQLDSMGSDAIQAVEPELPIHANLIEFPRELVATRKVRPRLAEKVGGADDLIGTQLSIFEVDPRAISTVPEPAVALKPPVGAEWTGIELDEQPLADLEPEHEVSKAEPELQLASMNRRVLSALIDATMIVGVFTAGFAFAASRLDQLPGLKTMEMAAAAGLLLTGLVYMAVFTVLTAATPGMRYARLSLCTFDDQVPNWVQRGGRLGGLLLSVLPLGLGLAWGLFDEEHLSWHDRLSRTYQRKC